MAGLGVGGLSGGGGCRRACPGWGWYIRYIVRTYYTAGGSRPLPAWRAYAVSSMAMRRINVYGPELRFAAAHFTTFGGRCEPLHGHNYALAVQVEGELSPDSWLFDFVELRRLVAALCEELDHAFLLPTGNRHLEVERGEGHYRVAFGDRRYVIPEGDVRALPIDNSTAERLAEWLGGGRGG